VSAPCERVDLEALKATKARRKGADTVISSSKIPLISRGTVQSGQEGNVTVRLSVQLDGQVILSSKRGTMSKQPNQGQQSRPQPPTSRQPPPPPPNDTVRKGAG
jgi:hypothetical protein